MDDLIAKLREETLDQRAEIKRLRAELARVRALGDALAEALGSVADTRDVDSHTALAAWKEPQT